MNHTRKGFTQPHAAPRAPVAPQTVGPPPPAQPQPIMLPDLGDLPMPSDDFTVENDVRFDPFLNDLFGDGDVDEGGGGGGDDVLGAAKGRYFVYVEGAGEMFADDDESKAVEAFNDWFDRVRLSDTPKRGVLLLDRTLPGTPVVLKKAGNPITVMGVDWPSVYEAGESQVQGLVQFFEALHRPAKYEAAVESVYSEYEHNKVSWFQTSSKLSKSIAATAMKQTGEKAATLQAQIAADQSVAAPPDMPHEKPMLADFGKYFVVGGIILAAGAGLYFFGPALLGIVGGVAKKRFSYPRLSS